jgi:hypothetical protein
MPFILHPGDMGCKENELWFERWHLEPVTVTSADKRLKIRLILQGILFFFSDKAITVTMKATLCNHWEVISERKPLSEHQVTKGSLQLLDSRVIERAYPVLDE